MRVAVNNDSQTIPSFEMLATPNAKKSKEAGRPIYDEQEVCRIRFAGNKQTVGVFPAHEVFRQGPDEFGFVGDVTYAMEYNDAYLKFKNGEAQTVAGTPLAELPFLSTGKRLELKALNIHTAETLAALDGQPLKTLGPGGRDLKNQAIAYLETAAGTANQAQLHDELEKRDAQIALLMEQVNSLMTSKGATAAEPAEPTKMSAFEEFEDADIINWIKDASPETAIDGRWGRKKLLEVADDINAKLAKKAA